MSELSYILPTYFIENVVAVVEYFSLYSIHAKYREKRIFVSDQRSTYSYIIKQLVQGHLAVSH